MLKYLSKLKALAKGGVMNKDDSSRFERSLLIGAVATLLLTTVGTEAAHADYTTLLILLRVGVHGKVGVVICWWANSWKRDDLADIHLHHKSPLLTVPNTAGTWSEHCSLQCRCL